MVASEHSLQGSAGRMLIEEIGGQKRVQEAGEVL